MKSRLNKTAVLIVVMGSMLILSACAKPDVTPTIPNGTPGTVVNPLPSPISVPPDLFLERYGNRF
jgi:hypothetical protein